MNAEDALKHAYHNPDLLIMTGSRLYGTFRTDSEGAIVSDVDLRGFCVPPWEYLTTREFRHQDLEGDHVVFSIDVFVQQLLACNPQIFELFFVPQEHIIKCSAVGKQIMELRQHIVSKCFYKRILGYSNSEWRKARGVKIVIPERTLTEEQVIQDIWTVFGPRWGDDAKSLKDDILSLLFSHHERKEVPSVDGISKKRRHEFETFGYCCSSACHSLRLVRQCTELLLTGNITFPRPDAEQLRDIKQGKMAFSDVEPLYNQSLLECEEAIKVSKLPDRPNSLVVRDIYEGIIAKALLSDKRLTGG